MGSRFADLYSATRCSAACIHSTIQYNSVQCSTVQYSTVQYSTVQYNTVQYSTIQYSTVQCSILLHDWIRFSARPENYTCLLVNEWSDILWYLFAQSISFLFQTNKFGGKIFELILMKVKDNYVSALKKTRIDIRTGALLLFVFKANRTKVR